MESTNLCAALTKDKMGAPKLTESKIPRKISLTTASIKKYLENCNLRIGQIGQTVA
jgi:hypothetical protein